MQLRTLFSYLLGLCLLVLIPGSLAQDFDNASCGIETFTLSPNYSSVPQGTHVDLYGRGNCDGGVRAVRFEVFGIAKAEIGNLEQWETFKTEEFNPGTQLVCFAVAGGNNSSWLAAERRCVTFTIEPAGSTASGQIDTSGSNGGNNTGNSGGSNTVNPPPVSPGNNIPAVNNGGSNCGFAPLNSGDRGQVTAGLSNRMRSGPGTGNSQIGMLPEYTQFAVLSGPYSGGDWCWYEIRLDNGTTGYTAAGTSGNPWLEQVSGASSPTYDLNPPLPPISDISYPQGAVYTSPQADLVQRSIQIWNDTFPMAVNLANNVNLVFQFARGDGGIISVACTSAYVASNSMDVAFGTNIRNGALFKNTDFYCTWFDAATGNPFAMTLIAADGKTYLYPLEKVMGDMLFDNKPIPCYITEWVTGSSKCEVMLQ